MLSTRTQKTLNRDLKELSIDVNVDWIRFEMNEPIAVNVNGHWSFQLKIKMKNYVKIGIELTQNAQGSDIEADLAKMRDSGGPPVMETLARLYASAAMRTRVRFHQTVQIKIKCNSMKDAKCIECIIRRILAKRKWWSFGNIDYSW